MLQRKEELNYKQPVSSKPTNEINHSAEVEGAEGKEGIRNVTAHGAPPHGRKQQEWRVSVPSDRMFSTVPGTNKQLLYVLKDKLGLLKYLRI